MSKWKVEQLLKTAKWCEENSSGIYRESAIAADMLRDYAAYLAAQTEWPSEEDVRKACRAAYPDWEKFTQAERESLKKDIRAALQSVRPPVGVVSDEDVARACDAASHSDSFVGGGYSKQAIRAALESYASCHAPTKD